MEILDLVRLPGYGDRKVGELSGGEAQRVSLARALILRPRVLLLDEPLSALDLRIRQQMEIELARIHNELGTTFLSVTHDQGEAMKLSDTVVVMNKGRIEQVGTPEEIYNQPGSLFCASFVGESNLLSGRVVQVLHDLATVDLGVAAIRGRYAKHIPRVGEDVSVLVRAEAIELAPASSGSARDNELTGRVVGVLYLGSSVSYLVNVALNKELVVHASVKNRTQRIAREDAVRASWSRDDTLVL
jgi:spermidine/putrescine transport system ATP-binding protein